MWPAWAVALAITAAAWAVKPVTVSHSSKKDFAAADAENLVLWSLGEVTLGRKAETILSKHADVEMISAVAAGPGGQVYVGTGTKGLILRLAADGAVSTLADLDSVMVTDLLLDGRRLLAATAGGKAGIYSLDLRKAKGKAKLLWSDKEAESVWAIAKVDRTIYAATAPHGKVYAIDAKGTGKVIFTAKQKTIRSIAATRQMVIAGAGNEGLVYRIDLRSRPRRSRVLLDAAEREVVAVAIDREGRVYAAVTNESTSKPPSSSSRGPRPPSPSRPPVSSRGGPSTKPGGATPKAPAPKGGPAGKPGGATPKAPAPKGKTRADGVGETLWGLDKYVYGGPGGFEAAPGEAELPVDALAVDAVMNIPAWPAAVTVRPAKGPAPVPMAPEPKLPPGVRRISSRPGAAPADVVVIRSSSGSKSIPERSRIVSGRPSSSRSGNNVYRIDTDGLVRVVARQGEPIVSMVLAAEALFLGTGGNGLVQEVNLDSGAAGGLAKLDPKRVTALAMAKDGTLVAGTTGPAAVVRISGAPAPVGTLTSKPIDAKQVARWGQVHVAADRPEGSTVTVATRTGNVAEPAEGTWSSWSAEIPAGEGWSPIGSPAGRFCQYRLTLKPGGENSPVVHGVRVVQQVGNLAPQVLSVVAKLSSRSSSSGSSASSGSAAFRIIETKAADPNGDKLRLTIYYRRKGQGPWIQAAKDLTSPSYTWDTRTVPDGQYEVKVEATDAADNSPGTALTDARLASTVTVDNTPPMVAAIGAKTVGEALRLTGRVHDANRIRRAEYVVDSGPIATVMDPADGIYDSPAERIGATIKGLTPGPHVIAVKVNDEYGNVARAVVNVTVEE